jgi:hypothetical protein
MLFGCSVLVVAVALAAQIYYPREAFGGLGATEAVPGETPGVGTTWLAPGNVIEPGVGVLGRSDFDSR